jgi:hypothetical protein
MPPRQRATAEVPLEDFNESLNMMVHAFPGVGKTRFGASAPNSVILSSEPGILSARRARHTGGAQSVVKVQVWQDAVDFVTAAENGDYAHRDWVVVDTASTLQEKDMKAVMAKLVADRPHRDEDLPDKAEHQKMQNSFMRWWERMIDLPQNVLFLCHTMAVDHPSGDTWYLPSIQGGADKGYRVANYCMGLVNVVGFMDRRMVDDPAREGKTKEVIRTLWQPYTDPEKEIRFTAKDHFSALGRFSDNLLMPALIEKINNSGTKGRK